MDYALKTPRLELVPVQITDAPDIHRLLSHIDMARYSDIPDMPSEKQSLAFVRRMMRRNETQSGASWSIRADNALIGCIRLNTIDRQASVAMIGYEIGAGHWGHGYASEALQAVRDHAHGALEIYRLEAGAVVGNDASHRVLLKAGFRPEGVERSKFVLRKQRIDMHLYGRLAND